MAHTSSPTSVVRLCRSSVKPCGRREQYDVETLKRRYGGEMKLTNLLATFTADCPKARSFSVYDRCKAVYERRG